MIFLRRKDKTISADRFYYPKEGTKVLYEKMAAGIKGRIELNNPLETVTIKDNRIISIINKKGRIDLDKNDRIVSTIPITELINLFKPAVKESVLEASNNLKYCDMIFVYVIIGKKHVMKDNWIFFPQKNIVFNRISEQKNFSSFSLPSEKTVLCAEVTLLQNQHYSKEDIIGRVKKDLIKCGLVKNEDIIDYFAKKINNVYPIWDIPFRENLNNLLGSIDSIENLYSVGRSGFFNYIGMTDCIDMSLKTVNFLVSSGKKDEWKEIRKNFDNYIVID